MSTSTKTRRVSSLKRSSSLRRALSGESGQSGEILVEPDVVKSPVGSSFVVQKQEPHQTPPQKPVPTSTMTATTVAPASSSSFAMSKEDFTSIVQGVLRQELDDLRQSWDGRLDERFALARRKQEQVAQKQSQQLTLLQTQMRKVLEVQHQLQRQQEEMMLQQQRQQQAGPIPGTTFTVTVAGPGPVPLVAHPPPVKEVHHFRGKDSSKGKGNFKVHQDYFNNDMDKTPLHKNSSDTDTMPSTDGSLLSATEGSYPSFFSGMDGTDKTNPESLDGEKESDKANLSATISRGNLSPRKAPQESSGSGNEEKKATTEGNARERISRKERVRRTYSAESFQTAGTSSTGYYSADDDDGLLGATQTDEARASYNGINDHLKESTIVQKDDELDASALTAGSSGKKKRRKPSMKEKKKTSLKGFFKRCETHDLVKEHQRRPPSVLHESDAEDEMTAPSLGLGNDDDGSSSYYTDMDSDSSFGLPGLEEELESTEDATEEISEQSQQYNVSEDTSKKPSDVTAEKELVVEDETCTGAAASLPHVNPSGSKVSLISEDSFVLPGLEFSQRPPASAKATFNRQTMASHPTEIDWSKPAIQTQVSCAGLSESGHREHTCDTTSHKKRLPRRSASFSPTTNTADTFFDDGKDGEVGAVASMNTSKSQLQLHCASMTDTNINRNHRGIDHSTEERSAPVMEKSISFTLRRRPIARSKSMDESVSSVSRLEQSLSNVEDGCQQSQGSLHGKSSHTHQWQRRMGAVKRHASMSHIERTMNINKQQEVTSQTPAKSNGAPIPVTGCLYAAGDCPSCKPGSRSKWCVIGTRRGSLSKSDHTPKRISDPTGTHTRKGLQDWSKSTGATIKQDEVDADDLCGYGDARPDSDKNNDSIQKLSASYGYLSPMPRHKSRSMDLLQSSKKEMIRKFNNSASATQSPKRAQRSLTTRSAHGQRQHGKDDDTMSDLSSWGNTSMSTLRRNLKNNLDASDRDTSSFVTGSRIRRIENVSQLISGLQGISRGSSSSRNLTSSGEKST